MNRKATAWIAVFVLLLGSLLVLWLKGQSESLAFFFGGSMMALNLLALWFIWGFLYPRGMGSVASAVMILKYTLLLGLGYWGLRILQLSVLWLSLGLLSQVLAVVAVGFLSSAKSD